jgi:hypothetical protein
MLRLENIIIGFKICQEAYIIKIGKYLNAHKYMVTSLNTEFNTYRNFLTLKYNFTLDFFFTFQEFLKIPNEGQNIRVNC